MHGEVLSDSNDRKFKKLSFMATLLKYQIKKFSCFFIIQKKIQQIIPQINSTLFDRTNKKLQTKKLVKKS